MQRRQYLHKEIRPFVADEFKDIVAPEPDYVLVVGPDAETENDIDKTGDADEPPPKKSKGRGRVKTKKKTHYIACLPGSVLHLLVQFALVLLKINPVSSRPLKFICISIFEGCFLGFDRYSVALILYFHKFILKKKV